MFEALSKLYPNVFARPAVLELFGNANTVQQKISSELAPGGLLQLNGNGKLFGVMVSEKYTRLDELDDEFMVTDNTFVSLKGVIYFVTKGHIQCILKNNITNTWIQYDGYAPRRKFDDIGPFVDAKPIIINEITKKTRSEFEYDTFDSLLVFEVTNIADVSEAEPVLKKQRETSNAANSNDDDINYEQISHGHNNNNNNYHHETGSDETQSPQQSPINSPPILKPGTSEWWTWAKRQIGQGRHKRRLSFKLNQNLFF